jgi:signal transduction histidine kinase
MLAETGVLLAETISSIRNSCAELRPATLDYSGLVPALEELAERVGRRGDRVVSFRKENMHERLLPEAESMLFRIVQEALTNCAKHSNAGEVEIVIRRQGRSVVLTVSDNGAGFDPGLPGSMGLGLLTMRERASLAGGKLSIISSPGSGTHIRVVIPAKA